MKFSFRQRLFLYFTLLFAVFTVGIAIFEHTREKNFRTDALAEKLAIYASLVHSSVATHSMNIEKEIQPIRSVLPDDLRITIIQKNGKVIYDNAVKNVSAMENHLDRKEILLAQQHGVGKDIRKSESNSHPYFYFAKQFEGQFVRVALPYDFQLIQFLKSNNYFLYFLLVLFVLSVWFIHRITLQFGTSIKQLRDFALFPNVSSHAPFAKDEIGEIGSQIQENYLLLEENKKRILIEQHKLLQHIQLSGEGVCFFSFDGKVEFYNSLFLQYLQQISDDSSVTPFTFLKDEQFAFLQETIRQEASSQSEIVLQKNGKSFRVKTAVAEDKSFEIILLDITEQEQTKRLKQEMTGNIAHELRTPVTSIRAYLETILEQNLPEEKKQHFIGQAFQQTVVLSELIKDMSIIAKMEEAPHSFLSERLMLETILQTLKDEKNEELMQKNSSFQWQLPHELAVNGNISLLTSIFRNLLENSLRYAGENVEIRLVLLNEDQEFYYFSFYDTGVGIKNEAQLNRLFERFYRVNEGRDRNSGGSGLGLSIVKNAIAFHGGSITAKNRKNSGLEFVFQLKK